MSRFSCIGRCRKNLPLIVKRHENSVQHQGCVVSGDEFLRIMDDKGSSVVSMLSSSHKSHVEKNRHVLQKIIEVILLCGRQNIPLRGHVEERSNFFAILQEIAKTDQVLSDHLEFSANTRVKYTSPDIQNELIELCGAEILNSLVDACKRSPCFAIIADECTDKATKEQLSLCLRFHDHENDNSVIIREEFVGFKHAVCKGSSNLRYHSNDSSQIWDWISTKFEHNVMMGLSTWPASTVVYKLEYYNLPRGQVISTVRHIL